MELSFFNNGEPIFRPLLRLGDKDVCALNGVLVLKPEEAQNIVYYCNQVWQALVGQTDSYDFRGYIRFDLVPIVQDGDLSIGGMYEVNVRSPECGCALSALQQASPEHRERLMGTGTARLAEAVVRAADGRPIHFLPGGGLVKKTWADAFLSDLRAHMDLQLITEAVIESGAIPQYSAVWRWGALCLANPTPPDSDFTKGIWDRLYTHVREGGIVVNTLPRTPDIGDKTFLCRDGEGLLTSALIPHLMEDDPKNWVLKPVIGSSGEGIVFGADLSRDQWRGVLEQCRTGGRAYAAYRARWLPQIDVNGSTLAMDLNAAFFANGADLTPLHMLTRMQNSEWYQKQRVINVSRGGAFTGVVVS